MYWSSIIDAILLMLSHFGELSCKSLLEIIYFATLETNGTILFRGIVHRILCYPKRYNPMIEKMGFYHTFIHIGTTISKRKETITGKALKVRFSSLHPRYNHHNQQPLQCNCGNEHVNNSSSRCQINHQLKFIMKLLSIMNNNAEKKLSVISNSTHQYYETIDEICTDFMTNFARGRQGAKVTYPCALFQVLSFFGFVDHRLIHWVSISSTSTGGFKLLKQLIMDKSYSIDKVSPNDAQSFMIDAKVKLSKLFKIDIPLSILDNILCEDWRRSQSKSGISNKRDILFRTPFKRGSGIQSLFRYNPKQNNILEILTEAPPIGKDNNDRWNSLLEDDNTCISYQSSDKSTIKFNLCTITKGMKKHNQPLSGHMHWNECTHITLDSMLTIDDFLKEIYMSP